MLYPTKKLILCRIKKSMLTAEESFSEILTQWVVYSASLLTKC